MTPTSSGRRSLGVVLTHPVQYYSPLFRRLAGEIDLVVYYAHRPGAAEQGAGFGVPFEWDIDLTGGYEHVWMSNRAAAPSTITFRGCDTPEIGERLRAAAHDAVLVVGWHSLSYWQAMFAAWRTRMPVFVRGDSQLVGPRSLLRRMVKDLMYPLFIRRFAACLSVGARSEAYFRHYGARNVFRSPHFVDNDFFRARAAMADTVSLRDQLEIDQGAFVVLFAGKLTPKKRPMDIVHAVARAGLPRVHILFAGDGELRQSLADEAKRVGVDATFAGFMNQTQLPNAYAVADVLVLPSDGRESWGLVVNEAMACGVPAIVSDAVGCAPDLVLEGVTGHVVPLGDVTALASRISELAEDRGQAQAMGERARAHVARYNVDAAARGVIDAIDAVVRERR